MQSERITKEDIKKIIGQTAASLVQPGMLVGLGTGTTAHYLILSLIERYKEGLKFSAIATSEQSKQLALSGGIPVIDSDSFTVIDLTLDGADEIDPKKRLIKGGGGALVREKIVASSSYEMVVLVDETKLVKKLGAFGLPIEIIPFGYRSTLKKLHDLGYNGTLRLTKENHPFITDNKNFIIDLHSYPSSYEIEQISDQIRSITGVVDTGLFTGLAHRVLVGHSDGTVKLYEQLDSELFDKQTKLP